MAISLEVKRIAAGHNEIRYQDKLWIAQTEQFYSSGILSSKKWLLFEEDMSHFIGVYRTIQVITDMLGKQIRMASHAERLRKELQRYPAPSYHAFMTPFDALPSNLAKRGEDYNRGLSVGMQAKCVTLSRTLCWSAVHLDGSIIQSYERIGYHANTAYFFAGLVASGVKIDWYTEDGLVIVQEGREQTLVLQTPKVIQKPLCVVCGQAHESRHCGYIGVQL